MSGHLVEGALLVTKSRGILAPRKPWTHDQLLLLRREFPRRPTAEVARLVGHSYSATCQRALREGLHKTAVYLASTASGRLRPGDTRGLSGRFQSGHITWNKGAHFDSGGRSAETRFKPGNRPHTWVPIGTFRINGDGYLDRKVTDDGRGPRDWVAVHRLVWEEANGQVPQGHVVVFRPGRRTTELERITPDAVELVTRAELMRRNSYHTRYPKEIGLAIQARGALMRQINKRERDAKQD